MEILSIKENEDLLFQKWKKKRPDLVSDGVVDEEKWNNCPLKILYALKEVNDKDGGYWDLRTYLKKTILETERWQTWNNIIRWTKGIHHLPVEYRWDEVNTVTNIDRQEVLPKICAVNIKKSPGGTVTNNNELHGHAAEDNSLLNEQFKLYRPDLIVCCGSSTSDAFHNQLNFASNTNWKSTQRGVSYHEYETKRYVISYSHPEARISDNLLYYGLIDAIREILNQNN